MSAPAPDNLESTASRVRRLLLGAPKSIRDPHIFHRLALVAFLAWVGLGADGLSSSAYGPEEAYRTLGEHRYLAVALALAMATTVGVISWSYSRIIEAFPSGGGGYAVAYKLLGPVMGAASGSALLVDYVLTISISIASGADAIFNYVPMEWHWVKIPVCFAAIGVLTVLNLRGVKESVMVLAPIFCVFLLTHATVLAVAILSRVSSIPALAEETRAGFSTGYATLGLGGLAIVFFRAYSLGGGTYTGIEAVANGMSIMREPRVQTARRTMLLMAVSLALTASGILLCYLLLDIRHVKGMTMNAVLVEQVASGWHLGSFPIGYVFAVVTLVSEAALLFVAAQAGFIDGPRVMSNMAVDSWLPHRFAALSDRLTMRNGILLMTGAALASIWYTGGDVRHLVVLYAINVFVTFSVSNIAMVRRCVRLRDRLPRWRLDLAIHLLATAMCLGILTVTVVEKFGEGGWITLAITGALLALCVLIRGHYRAVRVRLRRLDVSLANLPATPHAAPAFDPLQPTAILFVGTYGGLGIHSLLSIFRFFPGYFKNVVFVTIGVIDTGNFKGPEEMEALQKTTKETIDRYTELCTRLGVAAAGEARIGTDPVDEAEKVCDELVSTYPRHMFFGGKLVFREERWYERILHNETAFAIQRRLQWKGHPMMVLPVRVTE